MIHFNYAGVSGIGLTTGNKYQASGGDHFVSNSGRPGNEFTFVNNFLMTAPGRGNNLRVHELVHVTVNANGEITAETDNITVDCG
jgi:sorbitol-specific phosphotransferase system component IIA